ncbi:DUF5131 family protein [Streptomyces coerulescens]|uniref:DUF5131 family protein n=1 Tax=Streptomyces coerulescens TaxID=29304 RepID=A0ABW0CRU6_STRCD
MSILGEPTSCGGPLQPSVLLSLEPLLGPAPSLDLAEIDWLIVGGESGPQHRPLDLDWVRDIRDRYVDRQVAPFLQVNSWPHLEGRRPHV